MLPVLKSFLLDAALNADFEEEDIRWGYSGRGMYGRECFGLVGSVEGYGKFLLQLAQDEGGEGADGEGAEIAWELAQRVHTDNMAREEIFYFPGVEVTDG